MKPSPNEQRKMGPVFSKVDTIALFLFSAITFVLPAVWELWLAQTTPTQTAWIRVFSAGTFILKHLFAGFLNTLTRSVEEVLPEKMKGRLRECTANGIAMWLYQLPTYLVGAVATELSVWQILVVQGIMFLESPGVGWLRLQLLDFTRRRFGASEE
jgi:hypothetical protein